MAVECPCCRQSMPKPTLDAVVGALLLPPYQARVLAAVWKGKGEPVHTARLIDAMYEDDPDGGPSEAQAIRNMKVILCRLRKRLRGSGVGIKTVGYRQGVRLVLDNGAAAA